MSGVLLVLAVLKILVVIGYLMTMAALATWADRRQGAMIQDRIGPNRAVVHLPSNVARVLVLLPPGLLGVLALFRAAPEILKGSLPQGREALESATTGLQLAILVTWFSLVVLSGTVRKNGAINQAERAIGDIDPRSIFYVGLIAHALGFLLTGTLTPSSLPLFVRASNGLLALALFIVSFYSASRVPDGSVPLRLIGVLHVAADGIKLIWKEDFVPKNADKLLHSLAPFIAMFPALVTLAVVPFGDSVCFGDDGDRVFGFGDLANISTAMSHDFACAGGHRVNLQIADLNVGILFIFAMTGTSVVGAAIAGWASDNKFSLLGGLRAASQMVSYEVAMGLSLVGIFLIYGSVRLNDMVEWQGDNAWGVFVQPFGFLLFLAALAAETKRTPFDQPEGESEIVAGYFVEYSGMKFGMFYLGEYAELIVSSAVLTTLFFGGYHLPFLHRDGLIVSIGDWSIFQYKMSHLTLSILHALIFFGKTAFVAWFQVFFRWTLPRFRYDQLMKLGWTRLLPMSLANLLVTAVLVLAADQAGPGMAGTLKTLADISQAVLAIGMMVGAVALIVGLLEPQSHKRFIKSTAARLAAQIGGTKATTQQA